jgi:HlyD family secretion protein
VASAQQLAVDQASVDTAQANLADAQQALGGANLVSTISGTVASVSIAAGDSVTAGSTSSPEIVVIGTGSSYDVSTTIPVADIGQVSIGQEAVITPDSTNAVEDGVVSSIGVLATSGTTTTTYPVTISLDSSDLGQLSGADASVSIVVKESADVTTVPSSAVRAIGDIHLVTVVNGNTPKEVRVTLGTVGAVLTQVKSGVSPGETVSLADLTEPLPSTSNTRTGAGFGGAAGLGGAGFRGGGFGGGGGGFRA